MTSNSSPRAKRQAAQQTKLEREQRQRTIRIVAALILGGFALVGIIIWVATQTISGQNEWALRPTADPQEQVIPSEGRGHIPEGQPLTFTHFPPSSGNHYPVAANVGFYDKEFPDGYWVHSLEHGNVVVLYNCSVTKDCSALTSQVQNFVLNSPTHGCDKPRLLGVPYSKGMSTPISLLAWAGPMNTAANALDSIQLDLPQFDQARMLNFYKRYENHGPEDVGCPS
jgi:hypothetical protein